MSRRTERAQEARAEEERRARLIAEGRQAAEALANAVDDFLAKLVDPWSAGMLGEFKKHVAIQAIFCDEDPAQRSREELSRFREVFSNHLIHIQEDIREKLQDRGWEQFAREWEATAAYEGLLKSRFDGIALNLGVDAMNIAADVVIARREEMGIPQQGGEPLESGRRILSEARSLPFPS